MAYYLAYLTKEQLGIFVNRLGSFVQPIKLGVSFRNVIDSGENLGRTLRKSGSLPHLIIFLEDIFVQVFGNNNSHFMSIKIICHFPNVINFPNHIS